MKINYKDKEIELKNGFGAKLLFERIQQQSEAPMGGLFMLLSYFWCCIVSTKEGADITWGEFQAWLDENEDVLSEFSEWLDKQKNIFPKKN